MKKFRIALLIFAAFDFFILGNVAGLLPLTPMAAAQNRPLYPFVSGAPDCILIPPAPFTGVADSAIYDNRNQGCTTWHLVYNSQGFSALNISFKSADDSGNGPGAFSNWGTSGGTLAIGTALPLTATTSGQATGYKYRPFVKISVTSATGTGTIWPMLYGYRPGVADSSSAAGLTAAVQGVVAAGSAGASVNPVAMGAYQSAGGNVQDFVCANAGGTQCGLFAVASQADGLSGTSGVGLPYNPGNGGGLTAGLRVNVVRWNGATYDSEVYCPNTSKVNALGASTVALVAPVAGKKVRICSFQVSNNNATATTLKIIEGTGATCGTGTTDLTSLMNIGATTTTPFSANVTPNSPWTTNVVADGACAVSSAASSLEITYTWEQH